MPPLDELPSEQSSAPRVSGEADQLIEGIETHAIFQLDLDGRIRSWPSPAQSLYGYDSGMIVGESLSELFADVDSLDQSLDELLGEASEAAVEGEHWHERADGTIFWASYSISPLRDDGFIVISQDTTAKKQYEQMLERQNDRLKEFTDILAHDLRNPLNIIQMRLEQARANEGEDPLEAISETTDRMERLVEDLLRVARQGNVVTDPESVEMASVIETAWEGTGGMAEGAMLEADDIPNVSGDPDRLCELFENVFLNAIEHGGENVTVTVGPLDSGFYIEDTGPGIPPEHLPNVFNHGFTTAEDGSGYGLSIVRTIASAHGWDVSATKGSAGGARFEFTGMEFVT